MQAGLGCSLNAIMMGDSPQNCLGSNCIQKSLAGHAGIPPPLQPIHYYPDVTINYYYCSNYYYALFFLIGFIAS